MSSHRLFAIGLLICGGLASCSGLGRFYEKDFVVYDGGTGEKVGGAAPSAAEASADGAAGAPVDGSRAADSSAAADGESVAQPGIVVSDRATADLLERIFVLRMMSREFGQAIRDGLDEDGRIASRKAAVERELGVRISEVGAEVWAEARKQRLQKLLELEVADPAGGN